jgi:hypothetical protein
VMAIEYPLTLFLLLPAPWLGVVQAASETFRQWSMSIGNSNGLFHLKLPLYSSVSDQVASVIVNTNQSVL